MPETSSSKSTTKKPATKTAAKSSSKPAVKATAKKATTAAKSTTAAKKAAPKKKAATKKAASKKSPIIGYGTGRRKRSCARVFMRKGSGAITVNNQPYEEYFGRETLTMVVQQPLDKLDALNNYDLTITVKGGGKSGQASAARLGIARALIDFDADNRPPLKAAKFVRRDSREVERKKIGKPKARRSKQFSKR